eukprot:946766_1
MSVYFVARYNGRNKGTILSDKPNNFQCGFYNGTSGVCYWGDHLISAWENPVYGEDWVLSSAHRTGCHAYYCSQNCDISMTRDTYDTGWYCNTDASTLTLHVNDNVYNRDNLTSTSSSDWALSELIMIKFSKGAPAFHPFIDTMCIEEYLSNKYNIDSYRYTPQNIWRFPFWDIGLLFLIIASGCCAHCFYRGFLVKIFGDLTTHIYQIICFHCLGSRECCWACVYNDYSSNMYWYCCNSDDQDDGGCNMCQDCPIDFHFRGPCVRHCCGMNLATFPLYNLFSVSSSIASIILKCFHSSRREVVIYYLLNGCLTCLATIIHFIFINTYLMGNTELLNKYAFFYFFELEICIFLWCIMLIHAARNSRNTYNAYLMIVIMVYTYLIFLLCITIHIYYGDIQWTLSSSLYILCGVQCVFILVIVFICYYSQTFINYTLFIARSALLMVLMIVVTVDGWNDVYKVWVFSMLLTQYINLHMTVFISPSSIAANEYQSLHQKKKYAFQTMLSSTNYDARDIVNMTDEYEHSLRTNYDAMDIANDDDAHDDTEDVNIGDDQGQDDNDDVDDVDEDHDDDECNCCGTYVDEDWCRFCCQADTSDTDVNDGKVNSLLIMNIRCDDLHKSDVACHVLYLFVKDKLIIKDKLVTHINSGSESVSLNHEYHSNNVYSIESRLLDMIRKQSQLCQSHAQNRHFDIEDTMVILMFIKLPFFRLLFNQYLLSPHTDFIHLQNKIYFMDSTSGIEAEKKSGYTVLNTYVVISSADTISTPIIFSENIDTMSHFVSQTHNSAHGFMFRVIVDGKFAPISFLGDDFRDMYIVLVPQSLEIISDAKEKAQMCRDVLKLDEAMDEPSSVHLKQILQRTNLKDLFINHIDILTNLFTLYRGHDTDVSDLKLLSELLIKINDIDIITRVFFNIKTMEINMKALFGFIWLEFAKLDRKMDVLKLRKVCQEYEKEQCVGQILLQYQTSRIFERVPEDLRQSVNWEEHISRYLSSNIPMIKDHTHIPVAGERESLNKRVDKCMSIMQKYDGIINEFAKQDDGKYDELNVTELQTLFTFIDKEMGISKLMDTVYDLKSEGGLHLDTIKAHYECKKGHHCNILNSAVKTQIHGLRSRIPNRRRGRDVLGDHGNDFDQTLSTHEFCVMELLDSVHLKLFHKEDEYRSQLPNRAGTVSEELTKSNDCIEDIDHDDKDDSNDDDKEEHILFSDSLIQNPYLQLFCAENEYDSEAIYNDIVATDVDGKCYKNIYFLFKDNQMEMKEYNILKEELSGYLINPPDQAEKNRDKGHLLDLDFGIDVTEWNVIPMFISTKQEWIGNRFAPIEMDFYESLLDQSIIIAAQHRNESTYNLAADEILLIKMYTDTTNLQSEYRKAFRMRSKDERREQFIHWAIDSNVLFLKIEVLNIAYDYNKHVSNDYSILYHGLDRLFNTQGLVQQFYGALSTTPELSVAVRFAGASGMIIQMHQSSDFKNAKAISVEWISRFVHEEEVLLMNPHVIIQQSYVFSKKTGNKTSYLKKTLHSTIIDDQDASIFENLSAFLRSAWVASCLEPMLKDKSFMDKMDLFLVRPRLDG